MTIRCYLTERRRAELFYNGEYDTVYLVKTVTFVQPTLRNIVCNYSYLYYVAPSKPYYQTNVASPRVDHYRPSS